MLNPRWDAIFKVLAGGVIPGLADPATSPVVAFPDREEGSQRRLLWSPDLGTVRSFCGHCINGRVLDIPKSNDSKLMGLDDSLQVYQADQQ